MKAKTGWRAWCALGVLLAGTHAGATDAGMLQLGDAKTVKYACAGGRSMVVTYWSASNGQHFVSLPIEGKTMWLVDTFSGSGVRYQASHYTWWEKAPNANLYDEMAGPNAPPVVADCSARN